MEEPRNRAERRKMAKLQKQYIKKMQEYIKKHPEALKVELDEDVIKEAGVKDTDIITFGEKEIGSGEVEIGKETIGVSDEGENISNLIGK